MSAQRRVAVGATLYNKAEYLTEAVESLLGQTYRDFTLVLMDDASTDETPAIARRFAEGDDRVTFVRNERRVGMLENWRRAYRLAKDATPGLEYFAWGSDHDVWEPRFLERLVAALDGDPAIALAYPRSVRIDEQGALVREHGTTLDTVGIPSPLRRLYLTSSRMVAGNVVYGLIRTEMLERACVFRDVMYPDRLLVAELALHGTHRHVPELLWRRRFEWRDDRPARQRAAFWPSGAPWHARLPAWVPHAALLGRLYGPRAGAAYAAGVSVRIAELRRKRLRKRIIRRRRLLRAAAGRAARTVGVRRRRAT
jgi:glycosyltransferase involved in cell wall biosynthesis